MKFLYFVPPFHFFYFNCLIGCLCTTFEARGQSLEEAVSLSLISHPRIQQVIQKVKTRRHEETVAKSGYFPTLDLHVGIGHEQTDSPTTRSGGPSTEKHLQRREASAVLRQVIFEGFSTVHDDRRTKAATRSEQYRLLNTASEMALEVTRIYLEILMRERALSMARENLEAHEEIYYIIFKRSESGVQSTADLSQISGRLARARSNVIAAENNLSDNRTQFQILVGVDAENLRAPEPDSTLLPESLDQALRTSAQDYPLLLSALEDEEAADNEYQATKGRFFPEFSLEAAQSWNYNLNGIKGRDDDFTIMLHARYNIFSGGRDTGRMKTALSHRQETEDIYRSALLQVHEEVRLAWEARIQLRRLTPRLREHVESSNDTVNAYRRQFILGERTLLDVLNAENEKLEAGIAWNRSVTSHLEADYRLFHITGKLLDTLNFTLPGYWELPENAHHERDHRTQ